MLARQAEGAGGGPPAQPSGPPAHAPPAEAPGRCRTLFGSKKQMSELLLITETRVNDIEAETLGLWIGFVSASRGRVRGPRVSRGAASSSSNPCTPRLRDQVWIFLPCSLAGCQPSLDPAGRPSRRPEVLSEPLCGPSPRPRDPTLSLSLLCGSPHQRHGSLGDHREGDPPPPDPGGCTEVWSDPWDVLDSLLFAICQASPPRLSASCRLEPWPCPASLG